MKPRSQFLAETEAKARPLLDKHGLHDWRVVVENCRNPYLYAEQGALGRCDFENKVIRLDWRVGRKFRQTLLHEIAHALRGVPGHDAEWLGIALRVGCTSGQLMPYVLLLRGIDVFPKPKRLANAIEHDPSRKERKP